ncbi:putative oxidoreductase [Hordeum vulgare]|nr:putative oxidoreductase [Hordeum vulgare]
METRKEKHRRDKEEQMKAYMELQKKKPEMKTEIQERELEMEAKLHANKLKIEDIQAKKLEIEATKAKNKAKEVSLAGMVKGVKIMTVDLSVMSPKKRSWFERVHADMLKLNDRSMARNSIFLYADKCETYVASMINDNEDPAEMSYELDEISNPIPSNKKKGKTAKARGPAFTRFEDVLLVKSWLDTTLDPISRNGQKGTMYWKKIWKAYHE